MPQQMPPYERYIIAVKRAMRDQVADDWATQLRSIEALRIVGKPTADRVMVEAAPEAIRRARALLGSAFHVEPSIRHRPSGEPGRA